MSEVSTAKNEDRGIYFINISAFRSLMSNDNEKTSVWKSGGIVERSTAGHTGSGAGRKASGPRMRRVRKPLVAKEKSEAAVFKIDEGRKESLEKNISRFRRFREGDSVQHLEEAVLSADASMAASDADILFNSMTEEEKVYYRDELLKKLRPEVINVIRKSEKSEAIDLTNSHSSFSKADNSKFDSKADKSKFDSKAIGRWVVDMDGRFIADSFEGLGIPENDLNPSMRSFTDFQSTILTVDQIISMIRSSIISQRSLHLRLLGKLASNSRIGSFSPDIKKCKLLFEYLISNFSAAIVRLSLDEKHISQVSASLFCLHKMLVEPGVIELFEARFDLYFGYTFSSPTFETKACEVQTIPLDVQKCTLNVVEGLIEMQLIERLHSLLTLEKYLLSACDKNLIVELLIYLVYKSEMAVNRILDIEGMVPTIIDIATEDCRSIILLRIICCWKRTNANKLMASKSLPIQTLKSRLLDRSAPLDFKLQVLRLWRVLILHQIDSGSFLDFFPHFIEAFVSRDDKHDSFEYINCLLNVLDALSRNCSEENSLIHAHHLESTLNWVETYLTYSSSNVINASLLARVLHFAANVKAIPDSLLTLLASFLERYVSDGLLNFSSLPSRNVSQVLSFSSLPALLSCNIFYEKKEDAEQLDLHHGICRFLISHPECKLYQSVSLPFLKFLFAYISNWLENRSFPDMNAELGFLEDAGIFCKLLLFNDELKPWLHILSKVFMRILNSDISSSKKTLRVLFDSTVLNSFQSSKNSILDMQRNPFISSSSSEMVFKQIKFIDCSDLEKKLGIVYSRLWDPSSDSSPNLSTSFVYKRRSTNSLLSCHLAYAPFSFRSQLELLSVDEMRSVCQFLLLMEMMSDSEINFGISEIKLSQVYFRGSEFFLDPVIGTCLTILFEINARRNIKLKREMTHPYYNDLIQLFSSESFGDPGFARCILFFLRQEFDVEHRLNFWEEMRGVLKTIKLDAISPLLEFEGYVNPNESNRQLLQVYESISKDSEIYPFEDTNPFLSRVLNYHLKNINFS